MGEFKGHLKDREELETQNPSAREVRGIET